jgi:hypothetical protein
MIKLVGSENVELISFEDPASLLLPDLPDNIVFGVIDVARSIIKTNRELFVA